MQYVAGYIVRAALLLILSVVAQAESVSLLMKTQLGDITIELYPDKAPKTVSNFLRYVDAGHYRGGQFYRVVRLDNQQQNTVKIQVIQGGIGVNSKRASFPAIVHETTKETGILHREGVISMARGKPGTATSEFFICIGQQSELDFGGRRNPDGMGFAAFGQVVKGMEVVRHIQAIKTPAVDPQKLEYTSGQMLVNPVVINNITRIVLTPAVSKGSVISQQ